MNYIDVNILKPLGGTYVAIRDTYIKQAIREGKWLRITIPQGVGEHNPREWVKTGKRVEQVFKIPDHPMVLYRNLVEVGKKYKHVKYMSDTCQPLTRKEPVDLKTSLANISEKHLNNMRAIFHK